MSEKGFDENLKRKSKQALGWDLLGTFFRQLASFGVSILLARLLGPKEFGLIGMALVFVALAQVFVEGGFTAGIIQKKEVTEKEYSSIFFVNIGIGFLFSILLYFAGPIIARFYEKKEMELIISWLALIPFIASFSTVHAARLEKNLDLKAVAKVSLISTLLSGILGVVFALKGYGVISLIVQQLTFALFTTIFLWWSTRWFPEFVFSFKKIREILSYSAYVFIDKLIRTIFLKLDTLFVAKMFSPITLGYYSRAASLVAQVNGYSTKSISRVIFPLLSKVQDKEKEFEQITFLSLGMLSVVLVYVVGILYFLSKTIILGLLGDKWFESIVLFKILLFTLYFMASRSILIKAFLSKGLSKIVFRIGILQRALRLLPLIAGYYLGLKVFVIIILIVSALLTFIQELFADKFLNFSWLKLSELIFLPLVPLLVIIVINIYLVSVESMGLWIIIFLTVETFFLLSVKNEGFFKIIDLTKEYFLSTKLN